MSSLFLKAQEAAEHQFCWHSQIFDDLKLKIWSGGFQLQERRSNILVSIHHFPKTFTGN